MKYGDFLVFSWINSLGYDNTKWHCHAYIGEESVKEQFGFGTDEKIIGFVVAIWINYEDAQDLYLFTDKSSKPKYVLKDDEKKEYLVIYEFND